MKRMFAIMVALVALVAFTAPAWAADDAPGPSFTVQGRMLTDLGYHNYSKELTTNKKDDVTTAFVSLGNTSYLRSTFASADKTTGGVVELGMASSINNNEVVSLRFAYGWWKVGNCRLYAGQTDNWLGSTAFSPKQYFGQNDYGKNEMTNWGHIYGGRNPQAGFQWDSNMFGFQVALVQPNSEKTPTLPTNAAGAVYEDIYANMPRVDLALKFNAGGFLTQPGFGFSQVKLQGTTNGADDTATSWIAILPVKFTAGIFTLKGEFHYGNNVDTDWSGNRLAAITKLGTTIGIPVIQSNGKIEDTHQAGGFLALEFKIMPSFEITGGYGIENLENDAYNRAVKSGGLGGKNDNYTRQTFFVAFPYEVTKNFTIHPEFSYYDYGTNPATDKDFGNEWLGGIQFRFVF